MIDIHRITKPSLIAVALLVSLCLLVIAPQKIRADSSEGSIVFNSNRDNNNEIHTMDADGSNQINLTNSSDNESDPSVSSDSSKIAYVSNAGGSHNIHTMDIDGSNRVKITNNPELDFEPAWSPDGTKIAFTSFRDGNAEIYVMDADGSNQVNVSNSGGDDYQPAWSPDGTKIVFSKVNEIYVMDADGSNQVNVSNSPSQDSYPSMSPDGSKIAFTSVVGSNNEIYVMDADGSNQVNVSNDSAGASLAAWSPDGSKIAFVSNRGNDTSRIYTMNADGSNQVNVSSDSLESFIDINPSWYAPVETDADGDGISDATETAGPNGGDANADGIPDSTQANVTTLVNPLTGSYVSVVSTCPSNDSVGVIVENSDFKDVAFDYPAGLVNFSLTCPAGSTAAMTLFFFGTLPQNPVARKYNSIEHTYQVIEGSTVNQTIVGGVAAAKVQYQITDGGSLDQDETANGTIVDPVGLAQSVFGAPNTGRGGSALRP